MREWLGLGTPARNGAVPWIVVTLALGATFLAGQLVVWRQLRAAGIFANENPASWFFLVLTVTHALHLAGGMFGLLWSGASNLRMRPLESRQIATDISVWYWHAMAAIWIYVVVLLLLMN
jgi:cytochrome c oxidase subunit 3